jgi:hypothetical protein
MITRRYGFRFFAAAVVFCLAAFPNPASAAPAGTVVAISGQCFVDGSGRRAALKTGDAVNVSDTIDVPAGGKVRLQMSDGSVISVASGTRMTVSDYKVDASGQRQSAALSLTQGLLRAVVAPVAQPSVFEVSTAVGTAAVRSTDWFMEMQSNGAQVGVLTGSVALISSSTNRTVTIPARWGARLEAGRDPVQARVWAPSEFEAVIARTDVR